MVEVIRELFKRPWKKGEEVGGEGRVLKFHSACRNACRRKHNRAPAQWIMFRTLEEPSYQGFVRRDGPSV